MTSHQTTAALSALGYDKDWLVGRDQDVERLVLYVSVPAEFLVSGEAANKRLADAGFQVSRVETAIRPGEIPAPFWAGVNLQQGNTWQEISIG